MGNETTLKMSICTYSNGQFDVMLRFGDRDDVTLSGTQKLSDEDFETVSMIAPSCVWTAYERVTKRDE